jgi:hypothetical protein
MFGGVAQVMNQIVPMVPVDLWVAIFLALTLVLLLGGGYQRIEGIATLKVALFTGITFLSALLLIRMPQYFSWSRAVDGLKFHMPPGGLYKAVAVFGITGIGASEFFMYPYWCVEKGYARFAGANDGTPGWRSRVLGWTHVMQTDALFHGDLHVYWVRVLFSRRRTLNGMHLMPAASGMIRRLEYVHANAWRVGVVPVLRGRDCYSLRHHLRGHRGQFPRLRRHAGSWATSAATITPRGCVTAATSSGFDGYSAIPTGSSASPSPWSSSAAWPPLMMPVGIGAVYLRHRHLPKAVAPSGIRTVCLWISSAVLVGFVVVYLGTLVRR